ncbi:MAG: tripartite tricarboxylate transporter TctB family protein [Candidatus Rokubacteria bacterium]|nr:tripartite tricarboxylate transporter TctB family protein [Candidatus Rokubacteria bacterium]
MSRLPHFPVSFAGPDFFPKVLALFLGSVSIVLLAQSVRSGYVAAAQPDAKPPANGRRLVRVGMAMVASGLYFAGMEAFGFIASTIVYFAFLMFLMQPKKRIVKTVLWSVGTVFVAYLTFGMILKATLPAGAIFR